ncbi:ferredoxin family protein [Mycobacterium sp. 852002-40037_SCH5390672]|uniref:4Fe-4S dicluster domain-containing protein n=1 Tax=Mycobacterium sp. 852002-40037_SCH5390672 TaxID=1834089 RepID=UPI001E464B3D|nr:ferredoxin family protein [Mycobacterium sp. 852002-40037_SCH5390672]
MSCAIGKPCVDVMDRACVEEYPVHCIYEGGRALYIHPDECADCGAGEPVRPVEAIYYDGDSRSVSTRRWWRASPVPPIRPGREGQRAGGTQ